VRQKELFIQADLKVGFCGSRGKRYLPPPLSLDAPGPLDERSQWPGLLSRLLPRFLSAPSLQSPVGAYALGACPHRDFLTWEHLPIALTPSEQYDLDGCFSGSAVVEDGALNVFYTGVREVGGDAGAGAVPGHKHRWHPFREGSPQSADQHLSAGRFS
jgi:hypothetical protein